jgi:hypothetical protein
MFYRYFQLVRYLQIQYAQIVRLLTFFLAMGRDQWIQCHVRNPGRYRSGWNYDYSLPPYLWTSIEALGWTIEILNLDTSHHPLNLQVSQQRINILKPDDAAIVIGVKQNSFLQYFILKQN